MSFHVPEQYRVGGIPFVKDGAFIIPNKLGPDLRVIASEGEGWEHVSVSLQNRAPNWSEMCQVKDLFWDAEDTVIQYHPPASVYVNFHKYCLHLWKPIGIGIPLPPTDLIAPKMN